MLNYLEQYPLRIKQDIQVWFQDIIKLIEAGEHRSTDPLIILRNELKNDQNNNNKLPLFPLIIYTGRY